MEEYDFDVSVDPKPPKKKPVWVHVEGYLFGDDLTIGIHPMVIFDDKGGHDYHRSSWVVTHVPTGLELVQGDMINKARAIAIAERLTELGFGNITSRDGSRAKAEFTRRGASEVIRSLRVIANGGPGKKFTQAQILKKIGSYSPRGGGPVEPGESAPPREPKRSSKKKPAAKKKPAKKKPAKKKAAKKKPAKKKKPAGPAEFDLLSALENL